MDCFDQSKVFTSLKDLEIVEEMYGDDRRYSGYDEYEGIFGPLGGQFSRSSRPLPFSYRRKSVSSRSRPRQMSLNSHMQREQYLAERKSKRGMRSFADLNDNKTTSNTDNLAGLQHRQIWLPTTNFTFRQRAGKLDTRSIARLDLKKIVTTTDVDTIQVRMKNHYVEIDLT